MDNNESRVDLEVPSGPQGWADRVIPPHLLTSDDARLRARTLVLASPVLGLITAVIVVIRASTSPPDLGLALSIVDLVILLALPWVQRWSGSTRTAGAILVLALAVSLPLIAVDLGFFPAPSVTIFGLVPIIACFFVGVRFAVVIAVLFSAATLGLALLPGASAAEVATFRPTYVVVLTLMPLACVFLTAAFERTRERDEARLRRRTIQLMRARAAAEEADRHKSEFLRHVSHELRTPLNAIVGYSELIHEELATLAGEGGEARGLVVGVGEDIRKIQGAGRLLLGLINDLLDLSKIEAGALDLYFSPVDLGELFDEVRGTVAPLAQAGRNALIVEVDAELGEVWTDDQRLTQILVNLCGNACKFTEDGTITLRAEVDADDPRRFCVSVRDTGVGMSPEQASRIFAAFVQVDDSMVRRRQGTGLGLMITKMLSERLGGDVVVRSRLGEGSVFTVNLPRRPAVDVSHF